MDQVSKAGTQSLRKGRFSQKNRIYLITMVTQGRRKWFGEHTIARRAAQLTDLHDEFQDARVLCWVVMPDHIHVLLELKETPLHKVINIWKSKSGYLLNKAIGRKGRFWQRGYHDHALRHEEDVREVARYIIGNPLRARLVTKYGHYPYWNAVYL